MTARRTVRTPLGRLLLTSDGLKLTGARFDEGQTDAQDEAPVLRAAEEWLNAYFAHAPLPSCPALAPEGTAFQKQVWAALTLIPYGETRSYTEVASALRSSPRAVGRAAGANPLLIFVPCHRLIGKNGALTGYAAGLERKQWLLALENS